MTQPSRAAQHGQVVAAFVRPMLVHSAVACVVLAFCSIEPVLGYSQSRRFSPLALLVWMVLLSINLAHKRYGISVSPYLDMADVPVDLAKNELRMAYWFLWPHTGLMVLGSVISMIVLNAKGWDLDEHAVFWIIVWGGMILVLSWIGRWIQAVLLRVRGPSSQERLTRMAEAMNAGARTVPSAATESERKESSGLPFDRPPV